MASRAPDYTFLRRPVWIVGALVAVLAAALFVRFGVWQLSRHDQRRAFNAAIEDAASGPAADPADIVSTEGAAEAEYREIELRGRYRTGETVLLQNRSQRGRSGYGVVTPLILADGRAVPVNRGWVPLDVIEDPGALAPAPPGDVTVIGRVRLLGDGGAVSPARDGLPARISQLSAGALVEEWQIEPTPFAVDLTGQIPPVVIGDPTPFDPPEPESGPHLGYAVQWFVFAAIAVAGFPILVARTARRSEASARRRDREPGHDLGARYPPEDLGVDE